MEDLTATFTERQRQALMVLRDLGGKGSVQQIAEITSRNTRRVARTLGELESKKRVVRTSGGQGDQTVWRLRTWVDVDHDHIRDMARKGGVY